MVKQQVDMDVLIHKAINKLLSTSNAFDMIQLHYAQPSEGTQPSEGNTTGDVGGVGATWLMEAMVTRAPPAAANAGKPVVEDWECLRVGAWWGLYGM